jgi:hypothetical protein
VITAFLLVALQSFVNRIVSHIKRLRQPRYLIGAIAGAAYFYFVAFHRGARHPKLNAPFFGTQGFFELRLDILSLAILALALVAWALPGDAGGLEFTEAEIAFLFPAPLRRRDLLLYKIIRAQPQLLISSTIISIVGATRGYFIGLWAAFTVAQLYTILASLGRARLRLAGVPFLARLAGVAALFSGLGWYGWRIAAPLLPHLSRQNRDASVAMLHQPFHEGLFGVLLYVPRLLGSAVYPPTPWHLLLSVLALAATAVLLFLIAARLNVSFEEASVTATQKRLQRSQRREALRSGTSVPFRRMPAPFPLREQGPVEMAIIWKNLISLVRISIGWTVIFLVGALLLIGQAIFVASPEAVQVSGVTFCVLAALFPILGPNLFANDLRLDFRRLEVLKSYPISGERLVAAEIAAPLAVVAFFELFFLVAAAILLAGRTGNLRYLSGAQAVVVALLVAVPLCAVQLVLRNSIPILFPAWAGRSKEESRGIAFTGQRLIILVGNLLALGIALIPAAIVLLPSLWLALTWFQGHPASIAVATLPAVATIVVEIWLAIKFLGAQFERLDVANETDIIDMA